MTTCKMRRAYEIGRFHVEDAQQQHLRADLSRALHTPLYLPVDSHQICPRLNSSNINIISNNNNSSSSSSNNNNPQYYHHQQQQQRSGGILKHDAPSLSTTPPPTNDSLSHHSYFSSSCLQLPHRQHHQPQTSVTAPATPATPRGQSPVPQQGGQTSPPGAPDSPESLRKALAVLCLSARSPLPTRKRSLGNLRVTFADEQPQNKQQQVQQQVQEKRGSGLVSSEQQIHQQLPDQPAHQLQHQQNQAQQQGTGRDSPDSSDCPPPPTPPPTPASHLRRATVPLVSAPLKKSPDSHQVQQQFARGEAFFRDRSSSFEQIPEEGEWTGCLSEETAHEVISPGSAGSGRHSPSCGCSTCCIARNAVIKHINGLVSSGQAHSVSYVAVHHRSASAGDHASCRKELFSHVHDEEGIGRDGMQQQLQERLRQLQLQEQQKLQQKHQRIQQQLQRQQQMKLQEQLMQQKQQLQQQQKQEQQMRLQEQQNLQQKQQQEQRQLIQLQEQKQLLQQQEKQHPQQQVQHEQQFTSDSSSARKATATSHYLLNSIPNGEVDEEANATTAAAVAASYPSSARQQVPVSLQHLGPERNYATYPAAMAYPNMAVSDVSGVGARFSRHGGEPFSHFPLLPQLLSQNATHHALAAAIPSDEFYDDRREYATFPPMNPSMYRFAKTFPRPSEGENGFLYFNDAASSLHSWSSHISVASLDNDSTIGSLGYYPSSTMSSYNTPGSSEASWTLGQAGDHPGRLSKDLGSHVGVGNGQSEAPSGNDGYRSLPQNFPPMDDFMLRRYLSEVNRVFHQSYPRSQPQHPSAPVPPSRPPHAAVPPSSLPHQQVPGFGGNVHGSYPAYPPLHHSHRRYAPPVPTTELPPDMRGKPVQFAPLGRYLVNMLNNPSNNDADATFQGPDAFLSKFLECTCNTSGEGSWRSLCSMVRFQSQFYAGHTVFDFQQRSQQAGQNHHQNNDQGDGASSKYSSSSSGHPSTDSTWLPPTTASATTACSRPQEQGGCGSVLDARSSGCGGVSNQCQSSVTCTSPFQSEPEDTPQNTAFAADKDMRNRSVSLEELSLGCRDQGGREGRFTGSAAAGSLQQEGQKASSSSSSSSHPPPQARAERSGSLDSCLQDSGTQDRGSTRSQEQRSARSQDQGSRPLDRAGSSGSGSQDAEAFPFVPFQFGTSEEMAADFLLFCSAFGMAFSPPQDKSGGPPLVPASFPFPEFDPNWFRFLPGFPK